MLEHEPLIQLVAAALMLLGAMLYFGLAVAQHRAG
jgi:hypothetical protein